VLLINGYRVGKLIAVLESIALMALPVGVLLIESCAFKPTGYHMPTVELAYHLPTGDALAYRHSCGVPQSDVDGEVSVSLRLG
jgi:hypothetical protein